MNKKLVYFLIALFLISFFLRFFLAYYSPVKYWDETIYTNLGRNLVKYGEYSFQHGFADFSSRWPLANFRPPWLPLIIAFLSLFSTSNFILLFIIPIISSLGVLGLFFLVQEMFNLRLGIYSSVIFSLFPTNLFWGSKILNDCLFLTLIIFTIYFFYLCFFKEKGTGWMFGIFFGLSFLARYVAVWFMIIFFLALLIKNRNLKFIVDKRLWIGVLAFFIITSIWFIFNYFSYHSVIGFIQHVSETTNRWAAPGFWFYFKTISNDFIILLPLFLLGIFYRTEKKYEKYFFILWFFVILIMLLFTSNKEQRYLLPLVPAFCVISSIGLFKLGKYRDLFFAIVIMLFLLLVLGMIKTAYISFNSEEQQCFFDTMNFIKQSPASKVITEHFSPVYFYTFKDNIRIDNYTLMNSVLEEYENETIYYYYVDGDWFNLVNENPKLNNSLIYSCNQYKVFLYQTYTRV